MALPSCGGCKDDTGIVATTPQRPWNVDADGDGSAIEDGDCDDDAPDVYPGAPEVIGDGVDQDCDGSDRDGDDLTEVARAVFVSDIWRSTFGESLACGADVTGDGVDDIAAGGSEIWENYDTWYKADSDRELNGQVLILDGAWSGLRQVGDEDALVCGANHYDRVGLAVALQPDRDGDAQPEVYVAASSLEVDGNLFRFAEPTAHDLSLESTSDWLRTPNGVRMIRTVDDLDQDGRLDVVVGAPPSSQWEGSGEALVLLDALSGADLDSQGDASVTGPIGSDEFGAAVDAGDLDGDGAADLVVGAPGYGTSQGTVWWFAGPIARDTHLSLVEDPGSAAGSVVGRPAVDVSPGAVIAVGDLNGDSQDDLVFADHQAGDVGSKSGRVNVMFGPLPRERLTTAEVDLVVEAESVGDVMGFALAVADYDGDGVGDLIVGTPGDLYGFPRLGRVYVFRGPLQPGTLPAFDADVMLRGEVAGDWAGSTIAACDLDHDGDSELVIGARYDSELTEWGGKVYVVEGGTGL
jgi:hypothetical protein